MEFAKEEVLVTLVDGTERNIWLKKYINMPQKQQLLKQYTEKLKMRGNDAEWLIDFPGLQKGLLDILWCPVENKEITLNDVVPESIEPYVTEKMKDFLTLGMGKTVTKHTD